MTSPMTAFIDIATAGVSNGMNLTMQVGGTSGHSAHVGLINVDHRLRAAFGNDYGLVV